VAVNPCSADGRKTRSPGIPHDTEVEVRVAKAFPLGRRVHQQRKALRAGELEERRETVRAAQRRNTGTVNVRPAEQRQTGVVARAGLR
jgi:hypothetical protein